MADDGPLAAGTVELRVDDSSSGYRGGPTSP